MWIDFKIEFWIGSFMGLIEGVLTRQLLDKRIDVFFFVLSVSVFMFIYISIRNRNTALLLFPQLTISRLLTGQASIKESSVRMTLQFLGQFFGCILTRMVSYSESENNILIWTSILSLPSFEGTFFSKYILPGILCTFMFMTLGLIGRMTDVNNLVIVLATSFFYGVMMLTLNLNGSPSFDPFRILLYSLLTSNTTKCLLLIGILFTFGGIGSITGSVIVKKVQSSSKTIK